MNKGKENIKISS